jgi:hypothetical protein
MVGGSRDCPVGAGRQGAIAHQDRQAGPLCRQDDYAVGQQRTYGWRSSRPKESQGQFSRGSERGASSVAVSERLPIERAQKMAAESASGIPLELIALVTPLPADGGPVPGEIIEHEYRPFAHSAPRVLPRAGASSPP